MNTLDYFREAMKESHHSLLEAVNGLTDSQLHFRPLGAGNHIAFIFWHCVRTQDIMFHLFLQQKKPIWNAEGWHQKFGMDPKSQGTGMNAEQSAAVRIQDMGEFMKYAQKVFETSEGYLATLKEEALDEVRDFPVIGKQSFRQIVGGMVLHHDAGHLGEICYAKGLQGLKGSPV